MNCSNSSLCFSIWADTIWEKAIDWCWSFMLYFGSNGMLLSTKKLRFFWWEKFWNGSNCINCCCGWGMKHELSNPQAFSINKSWGAPKENPKFSEYNCAWIAISNQNKQFIAATDICINQTYALISSNPFFPPQPNMYEWTKQKWCEWCEVENKKLALFFLNDGEI